jgi:hypothetical protein
VLPANGDYKVASDGQTISELLGAGMVPANARGALRGMMLDRHRRQAPSEIMEWLAPILIDYIRGGSARFEHSYSPPLNERVELFILAEHPEPFALATEVLQRRVGCVLLRAHIDMYADNGHYAAEDNR